MTGAPFRPIPFRQWIAENPEEHAAECDFEEGCQGWWEDDFGHVHPCRAAKRIYAIRVRRDRERWQAYLAETSDWSPDGDGSEVRS